eukprot:scaffold228819_cov37-Tisochrysis_lutea.AAC.1
MLASPMGGKAVNTHTRHEIPGGRRAPLQPATNSHKGAGLFGWCTGTFYVPRPHLHELGLHDEGTRNVATHKYNKHAARSKQIYKNTRYLGRAARRAPTNATAEMPKAQGLLWQPHTHGKDSTESSYRVNIDVA